MKTTVTIHVSPELDAALRQPADTSGDFGGLLARHGLKFEPLFSDTRGPAPERIWHVDCNDKNAGKIVEELMATPGVEAAYTKPQDELPESP